jgi:SAM-dependent methyltransferase
VSARRRRPDAAGREALALFRRFPWNVRAHALVRWWSAPFPAVARHLPTSGRVLEIGCGHGLFAAYVALAEPGRDVVGVDIDERKVTAARAATAGVPGLEVRLAPSGAVPAGPWDAVVFVDVLYLLPAEAQRRLIEDAVSQLAPGGVLVVKEMGDRPAWKVRWNRLQETVSVRLLDLTAGSSFDFVPPAVITGWLQALGLRVRAERLDAGRVHPHHVLVATRG